MRETDASEVGIGKIELEVLVKAPRVRVWQALVDEIGRWWPRDFYAGSDPKGFVLEARLGGRMYEDWGDGAGLLWYNVIAIDPPRSLDLAGHLTPAFGGPAKTYLRLTLDDEGESTRLRILDSIFGRVTPASVEQVQAGWETLFTQGFKAFVEAAG
jgi:uncharacterized protein YndB with AHSA1/START domain